ncbi:hypothetical protein GINT2_001404 [Glugoides intestinalis]
MKEQKWKNNTTEQKPIRVTEEYKQLVQYINSIDFSLIDSKYAINNVYSELGESINDLCKDPFVSASLEKLISISSTVQLIKLLEVLERNLIYKKLGSRVIEKIYERLFDCLYKEKDECDSLSIMKVAVDFIGDIGTCILCINGTFVFRKALMLLSGKSVEKLQIVKYKVVNREFAKEVFEGAKLSFKEKLEKGIFLSNTFFGTLALFLQITRSQSLAECLINSDVKVENIKERSFLYEVLPMIAGKKMLEKLYSMLKGSFNELSLCEQSSYFMQSFLRNSTFGEAVLEELELEEFDLNSNVILALLESLQKAMCVDKVNLLIQDFYRIEQNKSLFEEFLLERHGTLDSKFVGVVVNFMQMPEKHNFFVNEDFIRLFRREWLSSKAGITLIDGFISGTSSQRTKSRFLENNIDLFWGCTKWKNGKDFIKKVCGMTKGHSRKKAYEILSRIEASN